jgi:hypothetical protein
MPKRKFAFRISESDYQLLQTKSAKADLTMTDFIIRSITDKEIVIIGDLKPFISELKGIGRNLNRLTMLSNMGQLSVVDLTETKEQLNKIYEVIGNGYG